MQDCEAITGLDALGPEWSKLAEHSGTVFATPEWARTWWRRFGDSRTPMLLRCTDEARTLALVPLYVDKRGPVRLLRFVGHGTGDVLGPVCDPADTAVAAKALISGLHAGIMGSWDAFLAERMPSELGQSLGGRLFQVEANPALEINGRSWDEYLASRSRNLREKLRRNTRKIEKDHDLRYRLCDERSQLDETLDVLFRLHGMRWTEGSSFAAEKVRGFHREFAAIAMDRGWLRLWTMEIDEVPVAAWYGFRFGSTEAYYQSGRDPSYDRFSVGFLLLMRTIQASFDEGLEQYSFLRGDESYKSRFATAEGRLQTRAVGGSPLGRAAIQAGSVALRSPRLRRRAVAAIR